eukprot:gene15710-biopygen2178
MRRRRRCPRQKKWGNAQKRGECSAAGAARRGIVGDDPLPTFIVARELQWGTFHNKCAAIGAAAEKNMGACAPAHVYTPFHRKTLQIHSLRGRRARNIARRRRQVPQKFAPRRDKMLYARRRRRKSRDCMFSQ